MMISDTWFISYWCTHLSNKYVVVLSISKHDAVHAHVRIRI
jgi:hypothetical protein